MLLKELQLKRRKEKTFTTTMFKFYSSHEFREIDVKEFSGFISDHITNVTLV